MEAVAVAGAAEGLEAIVEHQLEAHRFLHAFGEEILVPRGRKGADGHGHLAGEVTRGLHGIHARVEHRSAARHLRVEQPLLDGRGAPRIREPGRVAPGELIVAVAEVADRSVTQGFDSFHVMRLPMQAVVHAQTDVRGLGGRDHRLALLDGGGHRLLAHDVLTCLGGGDAVLRVQRVRRHHVHDRDVLGLGQLCHVGVREDVLLREAVLGRPFTTLRGVPGDGACKIDILSGGQFGRDALFAEAAESAEGDAEFALPGALRPDERIHADDRGCGEGGGLKEGTAAEMIHVLDRVSYDSRLAVTECQFWTVFFREGRRSSRHSWSRQDGLPGRRRYWWVCRES